MIPSGDRPEQIGKPNEQIFASRFFGDRAYVVAFEQVDPVYAIDLSVSAFDRLTGEFLAEREVLTSPVITGSGSCSVTVEAGGYLPRTVSDVRVQASGCGQVGTTYLGMFLEPME
jgi:hypothetical protein